MTDATTAEAVAQLTDQVAALTAAVQQIGGYAPTEEWAWIECDGADLWAPLAPREGAEPLRIECRTDLLNYEVEAIPIEPGTLLRDIWRSLTPHIRAWNVRALNTTSGEWEDVPPPRVMGPDAFKYVKPLACEWMAFVVKYARLREAAHRGKGLDSAPTPKPPNASASASSSPASASRKGRKGSTASSPTASTG